MNTGLNAGNPAVEAAFRTLLLHQALIALVIVALLGASWVTLRYARAGRLAGPGSDGGPGPRPAPPEPPGRRLIATGFGNLWLFDGFLQAQPRMPLGLPAQVIQPTAASSPSWVQHLVNWAVTAWSYHPTQAAAAVVWIQVGLGIWLLAAPRGTALRLAGLASAGWGLAVWVFGEAFGGIFAPGLSWLTGAPGAALSYVVAGALLALPDRAWTSPRLGRLVNGGLGLFLIAMAVLQAWPGRGSWHGTLHGQPGALAGMAQSMALTPQPGFLSAVLTAFGTFAQQHGFAVNLVVVAVLALAGAGFASGRRRLIRPALIAFGLLSFAAWVLVQDLGIFGGLGTDPNSMIPFMLLTAGGYLGAARTAAEPGRLAVGDDASARWRRASSRRPAAPRQRATAAGAWLVAALGGAGLIVVGAVPLAMAQASPYADPLLARAITGHAPQHGYQAPGFALTDQFGRRVTLASLRGRVVLLSFVNPACPDSCPPVWRELQQAVQLTGAGASRLVTVGIVLGPSPASPADLRAFDHRQGLDRAAGWLCLTGTRAQLERVWKAYRVAADSLAAAAMTARDEAFVIDGAGRVRAVYRAGPGPGTPAISSSFAVLFASAARTALAAP